MGLLEIATDIVALGSFAGLSHLWLSRPSERKVREIIEDKLEVHKAEFKALADKVHELRDSVKELNESIRDLIRNGLRGN